LTRGYRATVVAALACASLLALSHSLVAKSASHKGVGKTATAATAKAGKTARSSHKSAAAESKGRKGKSGKASTAASRGGDAGQPLAVPLVPGPVPEGLEADVALVRKAIDTLRNGGASKATEVEATISDPVARKLVEWIILRNESNGAGSGRYLAFIAGNPSWPSLARFRLRAEAMLWNETVKPAQILRFFEAAPPQSARGRLLLARALSAQGDAEAAKAQVLQAWRNHSMSADLETQVLASHSEWLSRADHKARMEARLFAGDNEAAMRAARRLGGAELAIAQARVALNGKGGNFKKLLEAVPAEARHDPGYLFAQAYHLRHENKVSEAAKVILSVPGEDADTPGAEEWWVERRILARKLLDIGDAQSAYLLMRDAAEPVKENSRVERHFMAGWIALRFLGDPAAAATHFARIQDVSIHPTSLARSHYWLGRTAEAQGRPDRARPEYQAAARSSAAYYGQLARARLGLGALELAAPPPPAADARSGAGHELAVALEILYALNERALIIPFMADLGDRLDDVGALAALGELAEQREDARGMLHLGKAALARGLPLDYYAFPITGVPRYSPIAPDIERALLFAIIRQESMFDPADWSSANAMGLMQVTPVAGRDTCQRFGCKFDVKRLKNDIPYNLQLGAAELAGVLQDYRGNFMLTFAAYNAGRGRVSEWIARFGDPRDPSVDPVDWVERIPFMETRNYVQRVMENMQVYRTRFGSNTALTIDADLRRGAAAN
jgi:soluble lytic murein transglycosylase